MSSYDRKNTFLYVAPFVFGLCDVASSVLLFTDGSGSIVRFLFMATKVLDYLTLTSLFAALLVALTKRNRAMVVVFCTSIAFVAFVFSRSH